MSEQQKRVKYPENIDNEAKKLWAYVVQNYDLNSDRKALLRLACASLSEFNACERELRGQKLTFIAQNEDIKANPLIAIKKKALMSYLACMKTLNLSGPDDPIPGRPSGYGP